MSEIKVYEDILEAGIKLQEDIQRKFLQMGKLLSDIKRGKLWENGYESFVDYLEHLHMSETSASKFTSIYEKLVLGYGISEDRLVNIKDTEVIYKISVAAKNKAQADELVLLGQTLSRSDMEKEVAELKSGVSQANCEHPKDEEVAFRYCKKCGLKIKIYNYED